MSKSKGLGSQMEELAGNLKSSYSVYEELKKVTDKITALSMDVINESTGANDKKKIKGLKKEIKDLKKTSKKLRKELERIRGF